MKVRPYLEGAGAGALVALLLSWWWWHPERVLEGPAFERPLPSGGIIVRRDPEEKPPPVVKQAAREAGGKLERSISLEIQPRAIIPAAVAPVDDRTAGPVNPPGAPVPACSCEPVRVDLGLVRMPDRTRRVVATAQGGEILSAVDIPLEAAIAPKALPWAAGLSYSSERELGGWLDRDLGPLRLGVEIQNRREGVTAVLRAGIRF